MRRFQFVLKCTCDKFGFFSSTPQGWDYTTCPFCGLFNDSDNLENDFIYCPECCIIYTLGCSHSVRGCTEDIYNAALLIKYTKYENRCINYEDMSKYNIDEKNGEEFDQLVTYRDMSKFRFDKESAIEFDKLVTNKKIKATFECTCNGLVNEKQCGFYPSTPHENRIEIFGGLS